jgi:ABC-type branched-subunit amino acid transport system substrate-binding protein
MHTSRPSASSRRDFLRITAGSLAAAAAATAVPGGIARAAASDPITLGFLGDLTKAIGFFNSPRLIGLQFAYQYLAEHENGIGGRRPLLRWYDHKSDPTEAVSGFSALAGKTVLNSSCGTGEQQLLKPRYEAEKFITFTCSASPGVIYPLGHVFATTPYFPNQLGLFADWLTETWDFRGKGRGPRVVTMSYPSPYGRSHITNESKAYLKQKGVEYLGEVDIPFVIVDATAPLTRAKQMGADWAFTAALFATLGPLLKENHDKGFGLKFAANSFGVDPAIIPRAGAKAAEAMHGVFAFSFLEEETDGIRLVKKTWEEKSVRPEDRTVGFVQAWMEAFMIKAVVEETLKRVGRWDRVTPRELIASIETWGTRDIRGLGRVTYAKDSRDAKTARIAGVRDGRWVALSDWRQGPQLVPRDWLKPLYSAATPDVRVAMAGPASAGAAGEVPCH